jgi:hypothetical protein
MELDSWPLQMGPISYTETSVLATRSLKTQNEFLKIFLCVSLGKIIYISVFPTENLANMFRNLMRKSLVLE